jgi:hypothetical protein
MDVLLSGLVGALLGMLATGFIQFWKFNHDEITGRIDDVCRVASDASILATEYWSKEYESNTSRLVAEAAIIGRQSILDGMYADVREFLEGEAPEVDQQMSDLVDILTGGTFSENDRPADMLRAKHAQLVASNLVVALRRAHRRTMPLYAFFQIQRENRARKLDMPPGFGQA